MNRKKRNVIAIICYTLGILLLLSHWSLLGIPIDTILLFIGFIVG